MTLDVAAFIAANLHLKPSAVPGISLYTAHPGSGLRRLANDDDDRPPYWAYGWAGGTVLARYILDHPQTVTGRRIVDLGTGSGIVAIAAMRSGAARVLAVDVDPHATAAVTLNAAANGVLIEAVCADLLDGPAPEADVLLVGDLFYDRQTAARLLALLDRCLGIDILVGDPYRAHLPQTRLHRLAEYEVPDFGASGAQTGAVFRFLRADA